MIKIITIVGARPQFIKASVLTREFNLSNFFNEIIIHTGQHYDKEMSSIFFDELEIGKPKYNLSVKSSYHGEMTGTMLIEIEKILISEQPDVVLVYGDTNSTLAGALASSKLQVPLVHVESGLRSFNKAMPEETNRIITDHLSDLLLCPNNESFENLKNEGLVSNAIVVGDIMVDSFSHFYEGDFDFPEINSPYDSLITIHRPSNMDESILIELFKEVEKSKLSYIFPIHPRTKKFIEEHKIKIPANIFLTKPLGYSQIIFLLKKIKFVITDSGGLQKETYLAKKMCFILRKETEWNDIIKSGWGYLIEASQLNFHIDKLEYSNLVHSPIFGKKGVGKIIAEKIRSLIHDKSK